MSQQNVIKIGCDRCKRVEERATPDPLMFLNPAVAHGHTVNPSLPQPMVLNSPSPAFEASLMVDDSDKEGTQHPMMVRFQDLCGPCRRSVRALLEQIGKKIDGLSPDRVAKKGEAGPSSRPASRSSTSSPHHSAAGANSSKAVSTGTRSS
jgi:hypothetical protein